MKMRDEQDGQSLPFAITIVSPWTNDEGKPAIAAAADRRAESRIAAEVDCRPITARACRPVFAVPSLSLMPQADSKLERLLAKRANGPFGRFGYLVDWRLRLRVGPKFSKVGLGPLATLAAFLRNFGFLQVYRS
jgi:hypothetical protein